MQNRDAGRTCRIPLTDADGTLYYWTAAKWCHGWTFRDHEGYERYAGKTWRDCVRRVLATAENYSLTARIN